MRTRRSWRNQDRLWRELGGPAPERIQVDEIEQAERQLARPGLRPRERRQWEQQLQRAKIKRAKERGHV